MRRGFANRIEPSIPGVPASSLSAADRRAVWDWLRDNDPAYVEFLQGDLYRALREAFDATPVFPREIVEKARHAVA